MFYVFSISISLDIFYNFFLNIFIELLLKTIRVNNKVRFPIAIKTHGLYYKQNKCIGTTNNDSCLNYYSHISYCIYKKQVCRETTKQRQAYKVKAHVIFAIKHACASIVA